MDLSFDILKFEGFLLIFSRVAGFFSAAPIFSNRAVNRKLRVLISACMAIVIFTTMDQPLPNYDTVLGYAILVIGELLVGLSIGFISNLVMLTLAMAGEFIDREIGFTMAQSFDSSLNANVTITAQIYDRMVTLVILITNLHHFIIKAMMDSFALIPVGNFSPKPPIILSKVTDFMLQYFSIGFRIAMPVFLAAIMLNIVLGILAKSSPQMNMFSVGMQLKVFSGLFVLSLIVMFIPNITNYLMEHMYEMVDSILEGL